MIRDQLSEPTYTDAELALRDGLRDPMNGELR